MPDSEAVMSEDLKFFLSLTGIADVGKPAALLPIKSVINYLHCRTGARRGKAKRANSLVSPFSHTNVPKGIRVTKREKHPKPNA